MKRVKVQDFKRIQADLPSNKKRWEQWERKCWTT